MADDLEAVLFGGKKKAAPGTAGALEEALFGQPASTSEKPAEPDSSGKLWLDYDPKAGTIGGRPIPSAAQVRINAALGLARGGKDVLDTVAQGLASGTSSAADWMAGRGWISPESAASVRRSRDETIAADRAGREEFNQLYGEAPGTEAGRIGGQIAATLPAVMTGGGAVMAPVNAMTRASPYVAQLAGRVGNSLLGRTAVGIPAGAAAGGTTNLLLSSASDEPLADQVIRGATWGGAFGGAAPTVQSSLGAAGRFVGRLAEPFTERGQGAIADRVIRRFAEGGPTAPNAFPYITGSQPTLAQATANPGIATLERAVRDVNPNPFIARQQANAEARTHVFDYLRGNQQSLDALIATREANRQATTQAAFAQARPVAPDPAIREIDSILASPAGQRDVVVNSLAGIRAKLMNQRDPSQLYGIRQAIDDMLDPLAKGSDKDGRLAAVELGRVKARLDNIIEQGAPGFRQYLAAYARDSAPITAQRYLQGLKLTDANGNITLSKVDTAIKQIEQERSAAGAQAAKDIPPVMIDGLRAIREDLRRQGNSGLGKSIGSNTFQNLATNNLVGALAGPVAAIEFAAGSHPVIGAGMWLGRKAYGAQNQAILDQLTGRLLDPSTPIRHVPTGQRGQNLLLSRGVPVALPPANRLTGMGVPEAVNER